MRTRKLKGGAKLTYRRECGVPVAERFFAWCREQCGRADLLPKSPLAKALKYALDREAGLSAYLSDRTCRWIPTISSTASDRSPWDGGTGCSHGPSGRRARHGHAIRRPGRSAETNLLRHRPGRIQHLQPRVNYGLVWPLTLFRTIGLAPDARAGGLRPPAKWYGTGGALARPAGWQPATPRDSLCQPASRVLRCAAALRMTRRILRQRGQ